MKWIIMPVLAGPEMTQAAISDCLAQKEDCRLLIINQGVDDDFRRLLELIAEEESDRVFLWHHQPPLPSLSASWNRALDFVWETGGTSALVINNDVRLDPRTYGILEAVLTWPKKDNYFVTAVGVTKDQYESRPNPLFSPGEGDSIPQLEAAYDQLAKGGPDFSCYMISKACHEKYRFDEAFTPAFCEDLDFHRRLMLGGDGAKIFSINLPYWHLASQTLKTVDAPTKMRIERSIADGSRAYYTRKWGGPVNQETFWRPFDAEQLPPMAQHFPPKAFGGFTGTPTTPALQEWERAVAKGLVPPPPDPIYGLPEAIGSEDFPLTHRPGEYMGLPRK